LKDLVILDVVDTHHLHNSDSYDEKYVVHTESAIQEGKFLYGTTSPLLFLHYSGNTNIQNQYNITACDVVRGAPVIILPPKLKRAGSSRKSDCTSEKGHTVFGWEGFLFCIAFAA
jgi:hypothetical protein